MTRIAVTGAGGFIGLHVCLEAKRVGGVTVVPVTREVFSDRDALVVVLADVDAVIHLAGQNRGEDDEVAATNVGLAEQLVAALPSDRQTRVVFASSTQRHLDNPYGRSKRDAEEILGACDRVVLTVAEITNVFGPGCRPFYNSVVATFCHQLTHGETPTVRQDKELELVWVVDLARELVAVARDPAAPTHVIPGPIHHAKVSELLAELTRLRDVHFGDRWVPDLPSELSGHLYRTLVTCADPADHAYRPPVSRDDRGYLFECVRYLSTQGQAFFSTTQPGIQRGNHYHTRKYEKFCVLAGEAIIRLRWMGDDTVYEFPVNGDEPTIVDMPLFWAHHIENTGDTDLMTLFWANEIFDPADGDTWPEQVVR